MRPETVIDLCHHFITREPALRRMGEFAYIIHVVTTYLFSVGLLADACEVSTKTIEKWALGQSVPRVRIQEVVMDKIGEMIHSSSKRS